MSNLTDREIIIGVTGSIAACRTADLVSSLAKQNAKVTVVMTANATRFVTALTFQTLSRNPVIESFFDLESSSVEHIAIGDRAEICLVAPATANIIGKYAHGIADDALSTLLISLDCPVLLAPAMNTRMWNHPAVRENVDTLAGRGVTFIEPAEGELACGHVGAGKLAPVEELEAALLTALGTG